MDPLGDNPLWTLLVAAVPALLCTILIFMDQQITAVIINRKEHKLKVRSDSVENNYFIIVSSNFDVGTTDLDVLYKNTTTRIKSVANLSVL